MKLTETAIAKLAPQATRFEVSDEGTPNLVLRVFPSGKRSWRYRYRAGGHSKRYVIGDATLISPSKARRRARSLAGAIAEGKDPNHEEAQQKAAARRAKQSTLRYFIDHSYEPWAKSERKTGQDTCRRIRTNFGNFLDTPMASISVWDIERWRKQRHEACITASTTNRDIAALRACLGHAVEWNSLERNPLDGLRLRITDRSQPLRILAPDEELRLRQSLKERDQTRHASRESANRWRFKRSYLPLPEFPHYVVFNDNYFGRSYCLTQECSPTACPMPHPDAPQHNAVYPTSAAG